MRNLFLILIFLLSNSNVYSQDLFIPQVSWEKVEIGISKQSKKELVMSFDWIMREWVTHGNLDESEYLDFFHPVYLNSDTLVDFIYEGRSGGEGKYIALIINKNEKLVKIGGLGGRLITLEQTFPDSFWKLYVINVGCCAEPSNSIIEILFDPIKEDLSESNRVYFIKDTQFPAKFSFQKKFKVNNSEYTLRATPEVINGDPISENLEKGNIVAKYTTGDIGIAMSQKDDITGRTWWFVIMNKKDIYEYHANHVFGEYKWYGWMSSRYLEELNK